MQENIISDGIPQMWSSEEIRELILYAKDLEGKLETANAQLIMMNEALKREEKKVRRLTNILNILGNADRTNSTE